MISKNKLQTLAKNSINKFEGQSKESFETGFKKAFLIIDENLVKELNNLEKYPFMGERIMALKIYKKKIQDILVEMEKDYE